MKVFLYFLNLLIFTVISIQGLEIIRIKNRADNLVLDIDNGSGEGKKVIVSDLSSDKKSQRWIVSLNSLIYGTQSTFQSLDQDGGRIKVLDEDKPTTNVAVWGNANQENQKWSLRKMGGYYLIVNVETSRCLSSNGRGNQVYTTICKTTDIKQLWKIENFSEVTDNWQEHWFDHVQNVSKVFSDNDLTVFYDKDMDKSITWINTFTGDVWRYCKKTYGNFGPNDRLFAIFHQGRYGGGHPGYYYSPRHDNKNVIDIGSSGSWAKPQGWNIDVIIHEIGHIVESTTKGYEGSPAFGIWGDSKWAEIFIYDVYKGIGNLAEANRIYNECQKSVDNFPRPGTAWFKNWFWPIYSNYGGSQVLVRFYDTLIAHWPKKGFAYESRMNMGEFVHFWSGASRANLKSLATNAFGWTSQYENEYQVARYRYPGIIY